MDILCGNVSVLNVLSTMCYVYISYNFQESNSVLILVKFGNALRRVHIGSTQAPARMAAFLAACAHFFKSMIVTLLDVIEDPSPHSQLLKYMQRICMFQNQFGNGEQPKTIPSVIYGFVFFVSTF